MDDEGYEGNEDFYLQLYDVHTHLALDGCDIRTRITIIDDDDPD